MNDNIKSLASEIAKVYYSRREDAHVSIDPALVLIVAEIVLEVIRLVNSCRETPQSFQEMCASPTLFQRTLLKRAVKQHLDTNDKRLTRDLTHAIIERAGSLTVEEIEPMFSSIE